jgi:hypothetical protein
MRKAVLFGLGALALLWSARQRPPSPSIGSLNGPYERTRGQSTLADGSGTTWRQTAGPAPEASKIVDRENVTFHTVTPKAQMGTFGGTDALPRAQVIAPDPVRALVNYFTPENTGAEPL